MAMGPERGYLNTARTDVGHLFLGNLHLDNHPGHIDDARQLIARAKMLIQLAFDKRRGHNPVDRSPDFRLRQLLVQDGDLVLQPGHVRFDLADLLRAVPGLRQPEIAFRLRQLPGFQVGFPVRGFRQHPDRRFRLADLPLADFGRSFRSIQILPGGQAFSGQLLGAF